VNWRKLLFRLYHALWLGVDLLLPPNCGGCGAPGSRWCQECRDRIPRVPTPVCVICGTPVARVDGLCAACTTERPRYRVLRSWSAFGAPVRPALHRLKYRRDLGLGEVLVPQLEAFVTDLRWPLDMVVPVPLGAGRLKERGYNQAGLIGWPLSLALGIDYSPHAAIRARETCSQVGLSRAERRDNVREAFKAQPGLVSGRSILLVDDVATTGATLSSCAEALYAAGARDVFALTVARAYRGLAVDT
jgi:competence protein ComFC